LQPYELFIGLRYTRARQRSRFISFISLVSVIGIALGITVLITVLSVMNGFQREARESTQRCSRKNCCARGSRS
jgi:lipoprotein-releasing system permease protein